MRPTQSVAPLPHASAMNRLQPQQAAWLQEVTTVFLQCRQYAKAQPLLRLLIRLLPDDPAPLRQMAYLCYQLGRYELALKYCRACEKRLPGASEARLPLLRSHCHLKLGQREPALTHYLQFLSTRSAP
ncbi:hypothetical protein O5O45_10080 [Hahella aquimaris]|uniref:hypothetical protein n=1 Tax=Hahella sp. HNIBRBA332 TaxID=3015983 RepID=UPI00273C9A67|nr:hypothetical protein [Hahella sp. HNIBRBA332]WLQ16263.1 hypothetical protein O5O45_10080 [Hahella sp. HNIBRBA332]